MQHKRKKHYGVLITPENWSGFITGERTKYLQLRNAGIQFQLHLARQFGLFYHDNLMPFQYEEWLSAHSTCVDGIFITWLEAVLNTVIIEELLIFGEVRRVVSRTVTSDCWRADYGLLGNLVDRVPWEAVLKGKAVQEGWILFNTELFKAQLQAAHKCC